MKIVYRPAFEKLPDCYANKIFTCEECGIKFMLEDSDVKSIVSKPITECCKNWYEKNINRFSEVHFVVCECGCIVWLDSIEKIYWNEYAVVMGGMGESDESNIKR